MDKAKLVIAGLGLLMLAGCAPDEKEVCQHLMKVYEGDASAPGYLEDIDKCVEAYKGKKERRGVNSYRREVECILGVDTVYKVRRCVEEEDRRQ